MSASGPAQAFGAEFRQFLITPLRPTSKAPHPLIRLGINERSVGVHKGVSVRWFPALTRPLIVEKTTSRAGFSTINDAATTDAGRPQPSRPRRTTAPSRQRTT